jgi:hypothetical protein
VFWTSGPWQMEAVGSHSSATAIGATPIATAAPVAANSAANPNCFTCKADLSVRVNLPPVAELSSAAVVAGAAAALVISAAEMLCALAAARRSVPWDSTGWMAAGR